MALSLHLPKKTYFWEIIKMGNVLNLGNVQAILLSSDSLLAKKQFFSMQSNAVNASPLSSNATSAATATLLPNTNLIANTINAGAINASSLVAFQRELERQSKQQTYEDKLNSLKQGIISAESKASLDSATASSAFYYANNKELSSSSNSSKAEFLKGKKALHGEAYSQDFGFESLEPVNTDAIDELAPVSRHDASLNNDDTDPQVIEQELKEIFLNSSHCASKSIFENELSLDDTPIFFGSEHSLSVSASVAQLVDNMVNTLLSYQSIPLNNALEMITNISILMKAVSDCSTTAIETISQSTVLTNQYNPKVIMLPLYVLGYSLIDYLRRYNCKEFNYKKERQKAEEKIAKNEKERKQRMAEFAASFQFNYS